ncbi:MAG: energy-coupling factor transporter transmembrane component T family protein [Sphingomonadales bacterium]
MPRLIRKLPPEAKLAYLLGVVVVLFALADPVVILALLAIQTGIWLGSGIGFGPLKRIFKRLALLFSVIALAYAFVATGQGDTDQWLAVTLGPASFAINLSGLHLAGLMCLRVLVLVMASAWVQQSGRPGDFMEALTSFRVPRFLAASIDGTLRLAAGGRGGGTGRGWGGKVTTGLSFEQIRRGKLSVVQELVERNLTRAQDFVAENNPALERELARDVAIIMGVAAAIMSLKMLQVMPGLPIAPGHKNVLIIPFFLLAASLTRMRLGGLWAGVTTGAVSVMLGFGKYGVLEIAHFAAPGLLADLLLPVVGRRQSRWLTLVGFALVGAIMGAGRFAANFLVIVLAGAPGLAFVLYLPMLLSQIAFGTVSAFVTLVLLNRPAADYSGRP